MPTTWVLEWGWYSFTHFVLVWLVLLIPGPVSVYIPRFQPGTCRILRVKTWWVGPWFPPLVQVILFVANFHHFVQKYFEKRIFRWKFLFKIWNKISKKENCKNHLNCLQYKRVLKIFIFFKFHILNITRFLAKNTDGWSPLEQKSQN